MSSFYGEQSQNRTLWARAVRFCVCSPHYTGPGADRFPRPLGRSPGRRPGRRRRRGAILSRQPAELEEAQAADDAETLKASTIPLYVHAPYLINVASANNRIRIPSRKILQDTCDAAAAINATAVIVHGGHADDNDMEAGFERWLKALDYLQTDVQVYLENTAGGDHAMARYFDTIGRLWDRIGDKGIGFCLDTCHAWAAGEQLIDAVDRIKALTGRIDLVHCNDSRDAAGSGADRHANIGNGRIDPDHLVAVVKAADAPVICETADEGRKDDIAFLREKVNG
ncbi:xylose isomerase-like TIM barrel family protein [Mycobacterium kansasii]|uniref:Xylose isomerase-like TIM barrel family protein n=1 Tax=Mycobacterium kansasii TaxID=1768 RepID=A0A1V3WFH6_MYCKA|nr:xylose isomerase-like TIM barrel family protein [Mycobacterium kansasii]